MMGDDVMYDIKDLKREMIYCSCGTESILLEWYEGDEEKVAYFNMWERRRPGLNLFDRIRLAWRFFVKGYITADDVILNTDDMRKLGNLLLSLANTWAPLTKEMMEATNEPRAEEFNRRS